MAHRQGGSSKYKVINFIRWLGSNKAANWSMALMIGVYLFWLIPFQIYGVQNWRIKNMATSGWVFTPIYLFFIINLLLCLYLWLTKRGKKIKGWLSWSFHASLILIILAGIMSQRSYKKAEFIVTEGQTMDLSQKSSYVTPAKDLALDILPKLWWRLDYIKPEFWKDKLLFTKLQAEVSSSESRLEEYHTIELGKPYRGKDYIIGLKGFGYAPAFQVLDPQGRELVGSYTNLTVFPPGQEDWFTIKELNWEVHLIVYPDAVIKGKKVNNNSMNLVNPLLYVYVLEKKNDKEKGTLLKQGYLELGKPMDIKGYRLLFPEIRYYGEFWLVRDKGIPALKLGLSFLSILIISLLILRWRRRVNHGR